MIQDKPIKRTCTKGTEYTLQYDGLYRWSRSGNLPTALEGGFSSQVEAFNTFKRYCSTLLPETSKVSPSDSLEALTRKADLEKWAELNSIEIPSKYKQPSAIRKYLLGLQDA